MENGDLELLLKVFGEERNYHARGKYQRKRGRSKRATLPVGKTLKDVVFEAYGGYICKCCGETEKAFLSLDHINEDGAEHRRALKGQSIFSWIKQHNFPEGFQILCMNCNCAKHRNHGVCPHQSALVAVLRR